MVALKWRFYPERLTVCKLLCEVRDPQHQHVDPSYGEITIFSIVIQPVAALASDLPPVARSLVYEKQQQAEPHSSPQVSPRRLFHPGRERRARDQVLCKAKHIQSVLDSILHCTHTPNTTESVRQCEICFNPVADVDNVLYKNASNKRVNL